MAVYMFMSFLLFKILRMDPKSCYLLKIRLFGEPKEVGKD